MQKGNHASCLPVLVLPSGFYIIHFSNTNVRRGAQAERCAPLFGWMSHHTCGAAPRGARTRGSVTVRPDLAGRELSLACIPAGTFTRPRRTMDLTPDGPLGELNQDINNFIPTERPWVPRISPTPHPPATFIRAVNPSPTPGIRHFAKDVRKPL
jgi:hypothetical protein